MNPRNAFALVKLFKAGVTKGHLVAHQDLAQKNSFEGWMQLIRKDRRITFAQVVAIVVISYVSAQVIVHNDLGCCNECARWLPKQASGTDVG